MNNQSNYIFEGKSNLFYINKMLLIGQSTVRNETYKSIDGFEKFIFKLELSKKKSPIMNINNISKTI